MQVEARRGLCFGVIEVSGTRQEAVELCHVTGHELSCRDTLTVPLLPNWASPCECSRACMSSTCLCWMAIMGTEWFRSMINHGRKSMGNVGGCGAANIVPVQMPKSSKSRGWNRSERSSVDSTHQGTRCNLHPLM